MANEFLVGINITWDGKEITVKTTDITVGQLANLFYGALTKIPRCREAMEIAMKKHKPSFQMDRSIFIYNLRVLKTSRGLSAVDLGDELNMNSYRINMIENNDKVHIRDEEIQQFAEYFQVDPVLLTTEKIALIFPSQYKSPDNDSKKQHTEENKKSG